MSVDIDDKVRAFVVEHVSSVAQLELLLLLRSEPSKSWTAANAAREFGLSVEMTGPMLVGLCRSGLTSASTGAEPEYNYAPKTPALANLVEQLALVYQERRVRLIELIYASPEDRLRSFADAFDLRKKKESP